jgi:hypothetical protein
MFYLGGADPESGDSMDGFLANGAYGGVAVVPPDVTGLEKLEIRYQPLKLALSLYKMQTNVFLLDFQRLEVQPLLVLDTVLIWSFLFYRGTHILS